MHDPAIDEKRVLVICEVDRIATFRQTLAARPWAFENNRPANNRIEEKANA